MILAGIDIGTNTLRLLIADTDKQSFREIHSDRKITRLGEQLDRTGMLSHDAQERTITVLAEFARSIGTHAAVAVAAAGTSALRNAVNAPAFTAEVFKRTGINIRVISGEEEARLTLSGVSRALRDRMDSDGTGALESAFVIDIGGGSTEIIATGRDTGPRLLSLPLGAVYLTERFVHHDPPTGQELGGMRHAIAEELGAARAIHASSSGKLLVGTAGTITTLAAMDQGLLEYDPVRINGSVLTMDRIDEIVKDLSAKPISERKKIPGLEPGREDIILAGAMIIAAVMKQFLFKRLVVSDWGLREGILFDLLQKMTGDG